MNFYRKLTDVRKSFFAKLFKKIKLYYLYRFILVKLGYQNPFVQVIKVISECNLNCLHCPWDKSFSEKMSTDEIKNKILEGYNLGCECVIFEGGEPTLRKDLNELIEYASNLKLTTILITNGLNDLSIYQSDAIWISVEGDENTHNKIRGNTFQKIKQNIYNNSDKRLVVLMTISEDNADVIEKMPELFKKQYVWYNFLYPYKNIKNKTLDRKKIIKTALKILKLKLKYKNILNSKAYLKNVGDGKKCYDWWTYTVNFDGTSNIGCTVEQIEKCNCDECYLACYAEPYHFFNNLGADGFKYLTKVSGFNFLGKK